MPTLKVLGQSKVGTVIKTVRSALGVDIRIFDQSGDVAQDEVTLGSIRSRSPKQVEIRVVGQTLVKNVISYFEENYGVNIEILTGDGDIAAPNMTLGSVKRTYTSSASVQLEEAESSDTDIVYEAEEQRGNLERGPESDLEIKINKFEIEAPDADGDCPISLEFDVQNNSNVDAALVKYDAFYFGGASKLIASSVDNTEECNLEHGDVEEIHDTWRVIEKRFLDDNDNITAKIQARLFSKEVVNIGKLKIPDEVGVEYLEETIDTSSVENNFGLTLSRSEVDEDGDVQLELKCAVTSLMDAHLEDVELTVEIFDKTGDKVEYSETATDVRPFLIGELDTSIWAKQKDLKGATANFSLVIYHQVKTGTSSVEASVKV